MTVELDYRVPTCYWLFRCKEKYLVTNAGNFSLMIVKLESLLLHKKGRNAPWNAQVSFKVIPEHTRSFLELTPINLLVHFCIFANHKRFYYVKLCIALVHHYLSLIMSIFLLKKNKSPLPILLLQVLDLHACHLYSSPFHTTMQHSNWYILNFAVTDNYASSDSFP